MQRYQIAVIGTGPAGLSAAVTAKIRNKTVLLLGRQSLSAKVQKAHAIQNYLGLPNISGEALRQAFQDHLDAMQLSITEAKVSMVYAMGDYFAIQTADENYEAESVILATGVVQGRPFPGEEALLGRGVSYCATCDAPLYRGKTVAVIGASPKEEAEAEFLAEVAQQVYYLPLYAETPQLSATIKVIQDSPTAILGSQKVERLQTKSGEYPVDGVFILRDSIAPNQLVPGLQTEENHVAVNRRMETSIPGCFACGDLVGKPYQYIKSAGEGNVAALSAVAYLDEKKRSARA
ncbi:MULTISPECIES: NAD(P)/FAD-dependent oxidoreductase [Caproicibacterium]|uniref:NAD(P)/FAD-dependent oxidoreductase n=1 Tax=Caproicibacterium argilliputei TaxID=3030016 RepID=A0AA97DAC8_9FIRM|nr:NAD(P)/FAD-dependent oxidoreductase [Caproicibacterium argilliputei]WOC31975.1 NAD(P)/FAD-dependent oxidoreductase [Caproicibacterium argilliputei]